MREVASFSICYTQFLDHRGQAVEPLPALAREPQRLIELYRCMVRTRAFDKKAIAMQRTGQLGTYASPLGQEAIGAGVGSAMRPEDVLFPCYRDYAAQFFRGVRMTDILLYWGGDERGMDYAVPRRDFPISIPVASQACHAVGVAYAMKLRREPRVAVCLLGDGSTSKGDFYESLNAATVWGLPAVFVINNNQWAISVPRQAQTHAATLAQKALAAGCEGCQVDGNDAIAVSYIVSEAVGKARAGLGPTLVEALSYRLGDHTTADDASRYRSREELETHRAYEPIARLRTYLMREGFWGETDDTRLEAEATAEVERAVNEYLMTPPQPPERMFDYLYDSLPKTYQAQRDALRAPTDETAAETHYASAVHG